MPMKLPRCAGMGRFCRRQRFQRLLLLTLGLDGGMRFAFPPYGERCGSESRRQGRLELKAQPTQT
jgi:hypothetical protein